MIFKHFKSYSTPIILLTSIILGGMNGLNSTSMELLQPILEVIGKIFINLILVAIVPLVFFSVASATEKLIAAHTLTRILSRMLVVFLLMSLCAAVYMIFVVKIFPPYQAGTLTIAKLPNGLTYNLKETLISTFSVKDFSHLFSHHNLLPLIIFAILVGYSAARVDTATHKISNFLQSGSMLFIKYIQIIMVAAPLGFFAYFSVLIHDIGFALLQNYFRVFLIYYASTIIYFVIIYSAIIYFFSNSVVIKKFWQLASIPALTALATCSSAASIPITMQACKRMGISQEVYQSVIPLGSFLHKQGSILGGVMKIAFLFGFFHLSFTGVPVIMMAVIVSILVGTVMGAIPSGGMLGETLILSCYGFSTDYLMAIVAIGILIDPLATMVNVVGNTVACLIIGKDK